jgi:xanthosine utilization system XapX-like protein
MISFWISVVPPKIAITGVGSVGCRVGIGFLSFTKKIWSGDQVAVQGSPRQISRGEARLLW